MAKIMCKVRNKLIEETPEEKVRQSFIDELVGIYNYSIEDMRLEYPVKVSPSDFHKSFPADIAILENGKVKIFVETKKEDVSIDDSANGVGELKNYMALHPDVKWGIWTNGSDKIYIEKVYSPKVEFKECFNIPSKGFFSVSEEIKHEDLKYNVNLKGIFKSMRAYLAPNAVGTTRDETIASELIKLVLCKTYDEKFTQQGDYLQFHSYNNDVELTFEKISEIYNQVKNKYDEVFKSDDEITLDKKSVFYVVNQLQQISLLNAERNVISDAFETIIGDSLKGSQGQFFTPKNVIKLAVKIINPTKNDRILDPACGSGGFLVESMIHVWKDLTYSGMSEMAILEEQKDYAMKKIYGIEKDDFLAQICKSFMAVIGDGKSGIVVDDSLSFPNEYKSNNIVLNSFDIVMTNPPFGKDIKLTNRIKSQFLSNKVDIAFLERCIDLLVDGGKLAIVLSESIFHAPSYKKFRKEFFYKNNVTDIIDLPHDTFRPYNNAKCIVIILEKNREQCEFIRMINIKEMGHDHNGDIKYVFDYENHEYTNIVEDDIPFIIDDLENNNESSRFIKYIDSQLVFDEDIFVPRYYFDNEERIETENIPYKTLKELIDEGVVETFKGHGSPKSIYKGTGPVPYTRVKDVINNEVYINPLDTIPEDIADKMRKDLVFYETDIIMVRRGSYRIGDVGQLHKKDLNSIYTGELQFFRVNENNDYGLTNHNLFLILTSSIVREQFGHLIFIDTTLPTFYNRWMKLKIPLYEKSFMDTLNDKGKYLFDLRKEYWAKFEEIND